MSVDSDFTGWAEPQTDRVVRPEPEGRHRADTVSNGISVDELLLRVRQSRN
ncbi:hypothetical protein [Kutzneria sp. NPDC052558]|uniref:hypothetical protein n=1 Tax=Kutzneria sp. NPDC052558 TaxID=3364121 RepID=UPI0037CC444B